MTITEFLEARIAEDETEANVMLGSYARGGEVSKRRWIRMLAECEAKRGIIERAIEIHDMVEGEWGGGHEVSKEGWQDDNPGTDVVRVMAAVYKDHPDYQQEWALQPPERDTLSEQS
jgi:hypothetical protein